MNPPSFWERRVQEYGPFFTRSIALLRPWLAKLSALITDEIAMMDRAGDLDSAEREDYLNYNFLVFGYRGVGEYFELIHEHRKFFEKAVGDCPQDYTALYTSLDEYQ